MKATKYAKPVWRENDMYLSHIIVILFLCYCSYTDMKTKYIKIAPTIIVSILLFIIHIIYSLQSECIIIYLLLPFIPGLTMLTLSFLTKEALGYGDSILLILCSIAVGMLNGFFIIILAFLFSSIFSIILLICGKSRKTTIPFVPFILTAFLLYVVW